MIRFDEAHAAPRPAAAKKPKSRRKSATVAPPSVAAVAARVAAGVEALLADLPQGWSLTLDFGPSCDEIPHGHFVLSLFPDGPGESVLTAPLATR